MKRLLTWNMDVYWLTGHCDKAPNSLSSLEMPRTSWQWWRLACKVANDLLNLSSTVSRMATRLPATTSCTWCRLSCKPLTELSRFPVTLTSAPIPQNKPYRNHQAWFTTITEWKFETLASKVCWTGVDIHISLYSPPGCSKLSWKDDKPTDRDSSDWCKFFFITSTLSWMDSLATSKCSCRCDFTAAPLVSSDLHRNILN